jgi:hydrogenase maturation protease
VSERAKAPRFLVIGYGNPGRLDDGLGPALAARLETLGSETTTIDSDYQLQVECAEEVSRHDVVVFADAAVSGPEPFYVSEIEPRPTLSFSSHSLDPSEVLGLAHSLFKAKTRGFVLGIRGYQFDQFSERLSEGAQANLAAAQSFLESVLKSGNVQELERADPEAVRRHGPQLDRNQPRSLSCKTASTSSCALTTTRISGSR